MDGGANLLVLFLGLIICSFFALQFDLALFDSCKLQKKKRSNFVDFGFLGF